MQSLSVSTYCWKGISMNFVTWLPIYTNWKGDNLNSILVIIEQLTKIVYYNPVKIIIDALSCINVIINMVIWHHNFFWPNCQQSQIGFYLQILVVGVLLLGDQVKTLYRFLRSEWRLDERQNSTIETYLRAFVNYESNNWARLLPMTEFAFNNTKNISTVYTLFQLNCSFYSGVF